jgi:hypothetical protein
MLLIPSLSKEKSDFDQYFVTCQLELWLARFEQEEIVSQTWLEDLKQAHHALFSMASKLVKNHHSGEIDEARSALETLKISYDNVFHILELNSYSLNIL